MISNNRITLIKIIIGALICNILTFVLPVAKPEIAFANPGGISTSPVLWLDASDLDSNTATANPDSGTAVTRWLSKTGLNDSATVFSGKSAPIYNSSSGINNGPAVLFNRVTNTNGAVLEVKNLDIRAGNTSNTDVTIFTVYRAINPVNGQLYGIWGQDNGSWDRFAICCGFGGVDTGVVGLPPSGFAVTGAGTGTRLLTVVYNGNLTGTNPNQKNYGPTDGSSVWFEGGRVTTFTDSTTGSMVAPTSSNTNTTAETTFRIGWDGDDSVFNGWIAELIVFSTALSDEDIVTVSNYLGAKYDLTIAPTPVTLAATNIDSRTATLNGTVNAHKDTTTSITIMYSTDSSTVRNNSATSPTVTPSQVSGNTDVAVSAVVNGLSPGTTYWYRVRATNSRGSNAGDLRSFTTTTPVVTSCAGAGAILNGSFEDTSTVSYLSPPSPTGWRTTARATRDSSNNFVSGDPPGATAVKANIELTTSGSGAASGVTAFAGDRLVEIAADANGGSTQGLYQDVNTLVGSRVFWSYRHHQRINGGAATEVSRFRAAPTPVDNSTGNITVPAADVWTLAEQGSPFGANASLLADHYDTRTASGWSNPAGTFEPSSSRTRFLFSNHAPAGAGAGNLIDDVRFTTYTACPISVRIVAGRTSNFVIRNVEQDTSTTQVLGTTFRYYAPAAAEISSLSGIPTGITASVSNIANTSSTFSLTSSQAGTYTLNYLVSYVFNSQTYNTTSTLTVEVVPEVTGRFPSIMPIHPALTSKSLSGVRLATATSAYVCVDQVDSNGGLISPATISASNSSLVSGVSSISSSPLTDSGTVAALTSQMERILISANSGVLSRGGSKYVRIRAASIDNTDGVARSCQNGITAIIQLRVTNAIQLNRKNLPLGNGRQN